MVSRSSSAGNCHSLLTCDAKRHDPSPPSPSSRKFRDYVPTHLLRFDNSWYIIHCSVTWMFSEWSRIAVGCKLLDGKECRLVLQLGPRSLSGFVVAQFWSLYLELLAACNRNFGPALTFCWAIPSKKVHHLRAIPFAAKCWKVLRRCISGQVTLKCISWGRVVWPGAFEILAFIKMLTYLVD